MAFPTGYVYHNGQWYNQATGVLYDPYEQVQDITEAALALLTPSADFIGIEYDVVDRAGGTRVKNTGTAYREVSGGATESVSSSTWTARGTGTYVGQKKRFTDIGNNALVEGVWNGTRWCAYGREQEIYDSGIITSTSNATQTVTFPSMTIPGGLLGLNGGIRIRYEWELAAGTPLTRVILCSWDGSAFFDDNATLHRRFNADRTIVNQGASNAQHILERQADYTTLQSVNTTGQDKTKESSADLAITGSVVSTFGSAQTAKGRMRVYWFGQVGA